MFVCVIKNIKQIFFFRFVVVVGVVTFVLFRLPTTTPPHTNSFFVCFAFLAKTVCTRPSVHRHQHHHHRLSHCRYKK